MKRLHCVTLLIISFYTKNEIQAAFISRIRSSFQRITTRWYHAKGNIFQPTPPLQHNNWSKNIPDQTCSYNRVEGYVLPINNRNGKCFARTSDFTNTDPKTRNILVIQPGNFGMNYIRSIGLAEQVTLSASSDNHCYLYQRDFASSLYKIPTSKTTKDLVASKLKISREALVHYSKLSYTTYCAFKCMLGLHMRPHNSNNSTLLEKCAHDSNIISEILRENIRRDAVHSAFTGLKNELAHIVKFMNKPHSQTHASQYAQVQIPAYIKRLEQWEHTPLTAHTVLSDNINNQLERDI